MSISPGMKMQENIISYSTVNLAVSCRNSSPFSSSSSVRKHALNFQRQIIHLRGLPCSWTTKLYMNSIDLRNQSDLLVFVKTTRFCCLRTKQRARLGRAPKAQGTSALAQLIKMILGYWLRAWKKEKLTNLDKDL